MPQKSRKFSSPVLHHLLRLTRRLWTLLHPTHTAVNIWAGLASGWWLLMGRTLTKSNTFKLHASHNANLIPVAAAHQDSSARCHLKPGPWLPYWTTQIRWRPSGARRMRGTRIRLVGAGKATLVGRWLGGKAGHLTFEFGKKNDHEKRWDILGHDPWKVLKSHENLPLLECSDQILPKNCISIYIFIHVYTCMLICFKHLQTVLLSFVMCAPLAGQATRCPWEYLRVEKIRAHTKKMLLLPVKVGLLPGDFPLVI